MTINNSLGPIFNWGHSVYVFHFVGDEVQLQYVNIHPVGTKLIQVNYTKLQYRAFWVEELLECTASLTIAGPQTHDLQPCLQQHLWYVSNLWG